MTDTPSAPKPAAPQTFSQKIAGAINDSAARADPIVQARFVESSRDLQRHRLATQQPAQPGAKPPPTMDEYIASDAFKSLMSGTQPAASERAAVVGDGHSPSAAAPSDSEPAAPAEPPTEADLAIPERPEDYQIELPPDFQLPPDTIIDAGFSDKIKQFAHRNKLPQGTVSAMARELLANDMARIAADKQAFTAQANSVIAATSAERVQTVGSFLERSAPSAAAALKSSMLKGGPEAVRFFEAAMKAMSAQTPARQPIEIPWLSKGFLS